MSEVTATFYAPVEVVELAKKIASGAHTDGNGMFMPARALASNPSVIAGYLNSGQLAKAVYDAFKSAPAAYAAAMAADVPPENLTLQDCADCLALMDVSEDSAGDVELRCGLVLYVEPEV